MLNVASDFLNGFDRIPKLFGLSLIQSLVIAGMIHCLVGIMATIVAVRKGRDWRWWLPIGLIGGTLSLVTALRLDRPTPK